MLKRELGRQAAEIRGLKEQLAAQETAVLCTAEAAKLELRHELSAVRKQCVAELRSEVNNSQ